MANSSPTLVGDRSVSGVLPTPSVDQYVDASLTGVVGSGESCWGTLLPFLLWPLRGCLVLLFSFCFAKVQKFKMESFCLVVASLHCGAFLASTDMMDAYLSVLGAKSYTLWVGMHSTNFWCSPVVWPLPLEVYFTKVLALVKALLSQQEDSRDWLSG